MTVALQGDFGKPRPALVIHADRFDETATVTILPITGALAEASPTEVAGGPLRDQWLAEGSSTSQVEWKTSSMALMGAPSR